MGQLLGVVGSLVTRDMEKAEILSAFIFLPLFVTSRACPQGSHVPEPASRVWLEVVPTLKEGGVKNHLNQLDMHKSIGPGRLHPRVLKELGCSLSSSEGHSSWGRFSVAGKKQTSLTSSRRRTQVTTSQSA